MASERAVIRRVIERVDASLPGLTLEPYFSEDDLYFASHGPQEHIPLASDFDLVVCLFWKRMGTRLLPARFATAWPQARLWSCRERQTSLPWRAERWRRFMAQSGRRRPKDGEAWHTVVKGPRHEGR